MLNRFAATAVKSVAAKASKTGKNQLTSWLPLSWAMKSVAGKQWTEPKKKGVGGLADRWYNCVVEA
jgi:hypothetical protein